MRGAATIGGLTPLFVVMLEASCVSHGSQWEVLKDFLQFRE
jgi:hypothetical protein